MVLHTYEKRGILEEAMGSYYDVDAILTDAQKVPCTFDLDAPGLGFVDNNAGGDVSIPTCLWTYYLTLPKIRKGTLVSLPLWLGGYLALQKFGSSSALTIDLPAALAPRVLNALKANPRTLDLRTLAPHFYELAARALDLFEEDEIVDVLTEVTLVQGHRVRNSLMLHVDV